MQAAFKEDFYKGKSAFDKEQYSVAGHYFTKALDQNPKNEVTRYYLAITQAYLKQYDKAKINYQWLVKNAKSQRIKELSGQGLVYLPQERKQAEGLRPIVINNSINKADYKQLTYQKLAEYKYDWTVRNLPPPQIKALENQKFHIRGYMIPIEGGEYFTKFLLVNSVVECFFCQPPPVNQVVQVEVQNGKVSYIKDKIVDVYGSLKLGQIDDPFIACVYTLKADMVEVK